MRKPFLFLYFLFASFLSPGQSRQRVQLKAVLAEAANEFQSFRGEVATATSDDSSFSSTVVLDGSKNNEIGILHGGLTQYHAYIADSATKKSAKELVEKWRKKIKAAAPEYFEERLNYTILKRKTEGHRFSKVTGKEFYSISIVCSKREIDQYYWVLLTISRQGKLSQEEETKEKDLALWYD
jgi:hypothetical protein